MQIIWSGVNPGHSVMMLSFEAHVVDTEEVMTTQL